MGRLLWLRSLALDRAAGVRRAGFWQPATCGAAPAALTAYRLRPCVRRVGGIAGVRAPCVGRESMGLLLVRNNAHKAWPTMARLLVGSCCGVLRESVRTGLWASRPSCIACACLLVSLQAASYVDSTPALGSAVVATILSMIHAISMLPDVRFELGTCD